jgi:hypothetical protein
MTVQDRQRFKILIVLLAVLGATLWFGYRVNRPSTASALPPAAPQTEAAANRETGARIRIDLVEKAPAENELGVNNVFQYRIRSRANERPPVADGDIPPSDLPPVFNEPVAPLPTSPPPPPPPPPVPFRYHGFAVAEQEAELVAFLADGTNHYNVMVGEVLLGRYRIARITNDDVEVEDLQLNRRQTLPLITQ